MFWVGEQEEVRCWPKGTTFELRMILLLCFLVPVAYTTSIRQGSLEEQTPKNVTLAHRRVREHSSYSAPKAGCFSSSNLVSKTWNSPKSLVSTPVGGLKKLRLDGGSR